MYDFGIVQVKLYDTEIEYFLHNAINRHRKKYNEMPSYIICDLDTRFKIMKEVGSVKILEDGRYMLFGLAICIVDGLTKHNTLEVK